MRPELVVPSCFTPPIRELTPETSFGFECCEFLERVCGWRLTLWQRWLYIHALEKSLDGNFRFKHVFVLIARQNGKSKWLLGLVLWRLFFDGARLVISTAQKLAYAERFLDEGLEVIESTPSLFKELEYACKTNGKHSLSVRTPGGKGEWLVQVSNGASGRSLSCDLVVLDELREHHDWDSWGALSATVTARARSQIVCASNAGDQQSVVLRDFRDKARQLIAAGRTDDTSIGLFEWSVPSDADPFDESLWGLANPSLGDLITVESLRTQSQNPNINNFKTENLCQWVEQLETGPFPEGAWEKCLDADSAPADHSPIYVGIDVSFDRSMSYVATAYRRDDGKLGVELVARRAGTDWVIPWLLNENRTWFDGRVALQARGAPVSSLSDDFARAGITVMEWGGPELAKGFGRFFDGVVDGFIRHRLDPTLDLAAASAATRFMGDTWVLDRKNSATDAAPLIACIAAAWLANIPQVEQIPSAYEEGAVSGSDDFERIFV